MRAGPPWTLTPTTSAGPGEDRLPGLALQGPQLTLVLGCGMGLVQQPLVAPRVWMCLYLCLFKLGKGRGRGLSGLACPSKAQSCFLCSGLFPWLQV